MEWIPTSERLPEPDINVLCYSSGDFVEGYWCSVDKVFKPEIECIGYMENDIMIIDVSLLDAFT